MIRALRTAFRDREWGTLALELIVVVVGILLALQAENWNEARLDAEEEARVVEVLQEDFLELRGQVSDWIARAADQARIHTVVATALDDGRIPEGEEETFRYGLQSLVYSLPPPQNSGTLEGLVAGDGLLQLTDPGLRRTLLEFHEHHERVEEQMIKFNDLLVLYRSRASLESVDFAPLALDRPDYWRVGPDETRDDRPVTGTEAKVRAYDLAALARDPGVKRAFVEAADVHLAAVQWGLGLREDLDAVLAHLTQENGA